MDAALFPKRSGRAFFFGLLVFLITLDFGTALTANELQWVGEVTFTLQGRGSFERNKTVGVWERHSLYNEKKDARCQIRVCGDQGPLRVLSVGRSASWYMTKTSTNKQDHRVCDSEVMRTRRTVNPGDRKESSETLAAGIGELWGQPSFEPAEVSLQTSPEGRFKLTAECNLSWAIKLDNVDKEYDACNGRDNRTEIHYAPGLEKEKPDSGSDESGSHFILTGPSAPMELPFDLVVDDVQEGDTLKGSKLMYSQSGRNGAYTETLTASWEFKRTGRCECVAIVESHSGDVWIDGKPPESTVITGPVEITTGRKSRIAIELGNGDRIRIGSNRTFKLKDPCSYADYDPYADKDRFWKIWSQTRSMQILSLFGGLEHVVYDFKVASSGVRGKLLPESGQDDLQLARLPYPRVAIQSNTAAVSSPWFRQLRRLAHGKLWSLAHTSNHFGSLLTSFTDQTSAQIEADSGEADLQELLPSLDELSSAVAAAIVAIDSQRGSTVWVFKGAVEVLTPDGEIAILHAPEGLAEGVLPPPHHFAANELKIRPQKSGSQ